MRSGRRIAIDLGASSPSTMCRYEITVNAITNAMMCDVSGLTSKRENSGSSRLANAGSPIQPRPSEDSVMPS